jgi:hypothetical protein
MEVNKIDCSELKFEFNLDKENKLDLELNWFGLN